MIVTVVMCLLALGGIVFPWYIYLLAVLWGLST